jgi:hypothetical protein
MERWVWSGQLGRRGGRRVCEGGRLHGLGVLICVAMMDDAASGIGGHIGCHGCYSFGGVLESRSSTRMENLF